MFEFVEDVLVDVIVSPVHHGHHFVEVAEMVFEPSIMIWVREGAQRDREGDFLRDVFTGGGQAGSRNQSRPWFLAVAPSFKTFAL